VVTRTVNDYLVKGVVQVSWTKKCQTTRPISSSEILVGVFWLAGKKFRPRKSERMSRPVHSARFASMTFLRAKAATAFSAS